MRGLRDHLMLLRIHTAGVTAMVLLSGALLAGLRDPFTLTLLALSGILLHSAGFSLNEVMDLPYDKKSPHLKHKPLVRGSIGMRYALFISVILFLLAVVIFHIALRSARALAILLISSALGISYDIWGKRFPFSDILAAGWFALLPLSTAAAGTPSRVFLWLLSLYLFLQVLFNNSVEGGMKDIESDLQCGSRGTLIFLGAREWRNSGKSALFYSLSLRTLLFVSPLLPPILLPDYTPTQTALVVLLSGVLFALSIKTILRPPSQRERLLKEFTAHEMGSFLLFILLLTPHLPLKILLTIFFIPVIWNFLFTSLLYGRAGVPRV